MNVESLLTCIPVLLPESHRSVKKAGIEVQELEGESVFVHIQTANNHQNTINAVFYERLVMKIQHSGELRVNSS